MEISVIALRLETGASSFSRIGGFFRTAGALEDNEQQALDRLYALAAKEAERSFPLDIDAQRRLANMVVFTYRAALRNNADAAEEQEQQLLDDCLRRFTPLQNAVSQAMRRRRV